MSKNEQLFNNWRNFSKEYLKEFLHNVEDLAGIVQNPMNYSEEQIEEWRNRALACYNKWNEITVKYKDDFRGLVKETLDHLRSQEILYDVYTHAESGCTWYEESNDNMRQKWLVDGNDGCVEVHSWSVNKQEALDVIKELVEKQGYTFNENS